MGIRFVPCETSVTLVQEIGLSAQGHRNERGQLLAIDYCYVFRPKSYLEELNEIVAVRAPIFGRIEPCE